MSRLYQLALVTSTIAACWLGMQIVHELGHVMAAYAVGETVHKVVLHPLVISRTDVSHDRYPQLVAWGGPVVGAVLPFGFLAIAKALRSRASYPLRFFTGFCLICNGAYLGAGSFGAVGDAGDLLRYGATRWSLIVFALLCVPLGLWLWNGLGPYYGFGTSKGEVDRRSIRWAIGLLLVIVVLEVIFGSR